MNVNAYVNAFFPLNTCRFFFNCNTVVLPWSNFFLNLVKIAINLKLRGSQASCLNNLWYFWLSFLLKYRRTQWYLKCYFKANNLKLWIGMTEYEENSFDLLQRNIFTLNTVFKAVFLIPLHIKRWGILWLWNHYDLLHLFHRMPLCSM